MGTSSLKAGIIKALAEFTFLARSATTSGASRRNLAASTAASLSLGTLNARAWVFDTRSVFALFAACTLDTFARMVALVVVGAAELAGSALDIGTKVALANTVAADLIGGTVSALEGAVVWYARSIEAAFAFFAGRSAFAGFTETVVTDESTGTFGGAGFDAFSVDALSVLTDRAVVDFAIAVVVESIADFGLGLGSGTSRPVATNTGLYTLAALGRTLAGQTLVDFAVAIVVFAIAIFGFCAWCGTSAPFSSRTRLDASAASGRTIACQTVVDLAVAVVVLVVANFWAGGNIGGAFAPLTSNTFAFTGAALSLAGVFKVVDHAVTIVVFAVADLAACAVCDIVECLEEIVLVVCAIKLACSTRNRHRLQRVCSNTRTKANHVGFDIELAEQIADGWGDVCATSVGFTVRHQHNEATAIFDRICGDHATAIVLVGDIQRTTHRGRSGRAERVQYAKALLRGIGRQADAQRGA